MENRPLAGPGSGVGAGGGAGGGGGGGDPVELGDLLWCVADLSRRLGVDPEDALRAAALRFRDRVRDVEAGS